MTTDSQAVIRALIEKEILQGARRPQGRLPCVVTLSREAGTSGHAFAERLAERLGVPLYDRNLLNAIANACGVDASELASLDERVSGLRPNWLENLIGRKGVLAQSYRRNLANTVLGIAYAGGVIVGRGANFLLEGLDHVLRLRLVGSLARRTADHARQHQLPLEEAERRLRELDREREGFVKELTGRDGRDPHAYDLVMNIDHLGEEARLELVLRAVQDKPCALPSPLRG